MTLTSLTINYYRNLNTPVFACFLDIRSAFDRVSHGKLLQKIIDGGAPYYLVMFLKVWYAKQRLFVEWGSARSSYFHMSNGIRQGSLISPYLFNVYIDDLNGKLSSSKLGCHIGTLPCNTFSYADDFAILAPSALSLNMMLEICGEYANENLVEFNTRKSVVLLINPHKPVVVTKPNIYLNIQSLSYVDKFKYLGHFISEGFTDDEDIDRERRNLAKRGNVLIRKFMYCSDEIKCLLFRSFCYQLYTCALWSKYKKASLNRLNVCYNQIMRRLISLPTWHSASAMFATLGVRSFQETQRFLSFSLKSWIEGSLNLILCNLNNSDAAVVSRTRMHWNHLLYLGR